MKKNMFRMFAIGMAAATALSAAGCSKKAANDNSKQQTEQNTDGENTDNTAGGENTEIPNPWEDCGDDLDKAAEKAGFTFPVVLSNYTVMATENMIDIKYPLDETRYVDLRKGTQTGDISGDYNEYDNTATQSIGGCDVTYKVDKDGKICVAYWTMDDYSYSAVCENGMSIEELTGVVNVAAEAK